MRKILRLSLFNIRKHKAESLSLIILIMISMMMLGSSLGSIGSIRSIFPEMMKKTECIPNFVLMDKQEYDPSYLEYLENEEDITECGTIDLLFSMETKFLDKKEKEPSVYMIFADESTEERIERFMPETSLDETEISELEHPVWLPFAVKDSLGFREGDTFTVILGDMKYPFSIAGFYESGFYNLPENGLKLVVSEKDHRALSSVVRTSTMMWYRTKDGGGSLEYMSWIIEGMEELFQRDIGGKLLLESNYEMSSGSSVEVLLYIMEIMSLIIFVSVIVMIRHRIASDIEDQIVSIGVLEALGYLFSDISLSYVGEYVILSAAGLLLGTIGSFALAPKLFGIGEVMTGHHGSCSIGAATMLAGAACLMLFVILAAWLCAGRVKKYPPVTAFRKGIGSNHFGRDRFPLDKTSRSVHLRLAMKGCMSNMKQNLGGGICIAVSTAAVILCSILYSFVGDDLGVLRSFAGTEISDVQLVLTRATDAEGFAEELRAMPAVRKVLVNGTGGAVKWGDISVYPQVYKDYSQSESIKLVRGRFPLHENEIMLPNSSAFMNNVSIGDTITVSSEGIKQDYLVTGVNSSLSISKGSSMLYFTQDGFRRLRPADRPYILEVFINEDADREAFIGELSSLYGRSSAHGDSYEERIRAEADRKLAILMERYGVDHIDYAIMSGDKLISGSSKALRIKEIVSTRDLLETSLAADVAAITLAVRVFTAIMILVIGIVLFMLMESSVRKQRHELGIMKSMGYTSRELMLQLAFRIMPAAIIAAAAGTLLSALAAKLLTSILGSIPIGIDRILLSDAAVIVFCFVCAYLGSRRIRKISVCELMTE